MKRTRQLERTDRDITNAVFALMEQKSFEKITVADILEETGINRSTFYQHFPDKYAVLERVQEHFVTELTSTVEDAAKKNGGEDLDEINAAVFRVLSGNRRQMKLLLSVRTRNVDMQGQMVQLFVRYLDGSAPGLSPMEKELMAEMTATVFSAYIRDEAHERELSEHMLDMWLDMSVFFFRLQNVPDAKKRLLEAIIELHSEAVR